MDSKNFVFFCCPGGGLKFILSNRIYYVTSAHFFLGLSCPKEKKLLWKRDIQYPYQHLGLIQVEKRVSAQEKCCCGKEIQYPYQHLGLIQGE
jgi:hypothetical protein